MDTSCARHHSPARTLLESCHLPGTGQQVSPDTALLSSTFLGTLSGNALALLPTMNRIATTNKRTLAFIVLFASTLLSYAKIVGVVLSQRLWRLPQRQLRTAGDVANRRLP
jgi:hypothetical protein